MSAAPPSETLLHASCVAIGDYGVLIAGPSGAGKSDLALRLIDRGATLIADDCTLVRRRGEAVIARAPGTIAGRIEVRGVGILDLPCRNDVAVALLVTLVQHVERMPGTDVHGDVAGIPVPMLAVVAAEASAPIKIELALRHRLGGTDA